MITGYRPPCFAPKCETCMYKHCCANAKTNVSVWSLTDGTAYKIKQHGNITGSI